MSNSETGAFIGGKTASKGPTLGARHLQTLLLHLSLAICFVSRIHIGIALVAMTDAQTTNPNFPEFDWNEKQKSYILSSFFWGCTISQIPGGYATKRFGAKASLIIGIFLNGILGLLVPFCVFRGGWKIYCVIRVLQGLCQGILFPCVYQHLAIWSPMKERNRLGPLSLMGMQTGTIVSMYVTGMIAASNLGWPGISYVFSGSEIVFSFLLLIFAENSPADAKFISEAERKYILSSQSNTENTLDKKKSITVPWKAILTSVPFISLLIVRTCDSWGFSTMQAQIPAYLHGVLKMEIKKNAFYSALPYVATTALSFVFMILADIILNNKWISLLVLRKTFNTIAFWVPAAFLVGIGFLSESQTVLAVVFITMNVGLNSGATIGSSMNGIDLSTNHIGILMGIVNSLSSIVRIVSPIAVGLIVNDETNRSQWQIVFLITAGLFFLGNLQYLFFAQTDVQPWDSEDFLTKCDTEQGVKMTNAPVKDS
ncbi:putative inorganic phosphate cotransporter [Episyrphus balteatus]|uniref:putative inorganic phosphate cotransporter n=1 Tax=Episyrphus balteatus TaxID=286459 RepID=UPI00248692B4|nr:putative inorganic phosphate cotransporter [Episyrphus balteatus]